MNNVTSLDEARRNKLRDNYYRETAEHVSAFLGTPAEMTLKFIDEIANSDELELLAGMKGLE